MENKTFYALVLGALAVAAAIGSVASVSFASAQSPENVKAMKAVRFEGAPDFLTFNATIPEIKGSVDAGKELLSLAQVDFTTAAKTASEVGNGTVISGQMAVEQDYLVYSFDVVSGGQERTLIIDAGNGKVLHMTEARLSTYGQSLATEASLALQATPQPLASPTWRSSCSQRRKKSSREESCAALPLFNFFIFHIISVIIPTRWHTCLPRREDF